MKLTKEQQLRIINTYSMIKRGRLPTSAEIRECPPTAQTNKESERKEPPRKDEGKSL